MDMECAVNFNCTFNALEAGLYAVLVNMKICKLDKGSEACDSIRELREEQLATSAVGQSAWLATQRSWVLTRPCPEAHYVPSFPVFGDLK
jgi:hypothetical protein